MEEAQMKFTNMRRPSMLPWQILIPLTFGLLLSGCTAVTSLRPPYEEKDLVTQPNLAGTWDEDKDACSDAIEVNIVALPASKSYELSVTGTDEPTKSWMWKYDLNLARLKDSFLADVVLDSLTSPKGEEIRSNDTLGGVTPHFFARIWIEGDHLRLAAPDGDSVETVVESRQANVQLQRISGYLILTGDTPEIRDFLTKYSEQIFPASRSCSFTRRK
jgi:uncharacterized protein YceK